MNPNTKPRRAPAGTNAFAKSIVVKATPGYLASLSCYNANAGTLYLQLHDATSLPSNGAVPLIEVAVPAASLASFDFNAYALPFAAGIVAALSTTAATLTLTAANDGLFCAIYQ